MSKKQWQEKEKEDQKTFGAKGTPRSGGLWFAKGDSKSDIFLIENKTSAKISFSIKEKTWEKIANEAIVNSRIPMMSLEFGKKKLELIVLDKNDFIELMK
jgi:hypothetical protein